MEKSFIRAPQFTHRCSPPSDISLPQVLQRILPSSLVSNTCTIFFLQTEQAMLKLFLSGAVAHPEIMAPITKTIVTANNLLMMLFFFMAMMAFLFKAIYSKGGHLYCIRIYAGKSTLFSIPGCCTFWTGFFFPFLHN